MIKWFGAYAWCWPSMAAGLACVLLGKADDNNHLCFFFGGICMGIAIHQWMVAYATYGLKGKP